MKLRLLLILVLVCALISATASAADGPDASDPPQTSGPLIGHSFECDDNGAAGPGQVKGQMCAWFYSLAPLHTDPINDYSVQWVQIEVDPGKGWCATHLSFKIHTPPDVRLVSAIPDAGRKILRDQDETVELVVDGEGAAPLPGTVSQSIAYAKGRTRVKMDEHSYRFVWEGRSPKKVMVAIGLEFSSPRIPEELFALWAEGVAVGSESCRRDRMSIPFG